MPAPRPQLRGRGLVVEAFPRRPNPINSPPQDLAAIKAGAYKLPWDMTTPNNRQFNPLFVARK
jgi:hypothetical protein